MHKGKDENQVVILQTDELNYVSRSTQRRTFHELQRRCPTGTSTENPHHQLSHV